MSNICSYRKIEDALKRDIHFIWLVGYEKPDFKTINNFRNRVKDEIGNIFTQLVLLLAEHGLVGLDVEYIDGAKIESKANKYTFVWRKTVEKSRAGLLEKINVLLLQIDDSVAQDWAAEQETVEFTPETLSSLIDGLKDALHKEDARVRKIRRNSAARKGSRLDCWRSTATSSRSMTCVLSKSAAATPCRRPTPTPHSCA